jgi:hypothetical protein
VSARVRRYLVSPWVGFCLTAIAAAMVIRPPRHLGPYLIIGGICAGYLLYIGRETVGERRPVVTAAYWNLMTWVFLATGAVGAVIIMGRTHSQIGSWLALLVAGGLAIGCQWMARELRREEHAG